MSLILPSRITSENHPLSEAGKKVVSQLLGGSSWIIPVSAVQDVLHNMPRPPLGDPDAWLRPGPEDKFPRGTVPLWGPPGEEDAGRHSPYFYESDGSMVGDVVIRHRVPYWLVAFACLNMGADPYPAELSARFHAAVKLSLLFPTYAPSSARICMENYKGYAVP